jgi:hypothetical protein
MIARRSIVLSNDGIERIFGRNDGGGGGGGERGAIQVVRDDGEKSAVDSRGRGRGGGGKLTRTRSGDADDGDDNERGEEGGVYV